MIAQAPKFVSYLRVSTARQGRSGLGLDAQREAVRLFLTSRGGVLVASDFVEIETGKRNDRPELEKALKRAKITGATLVVAKLDRLSRNAAFLMNLQDSEVPFVAADMPQANSMTVGVMALVAQHERQAISQRTKDALAAARARGTALGGQRQGAAKISNYQRKGVLAAQIQAYEAAERLRESFEALQGMSLNAMAASLNKDSVTTRHGKQWTPTAVRRTIEHLKTRK